MLAWCSSNSSPAQTTLGSSSVSLGSSSSTLAQSSWVRLYVQWMFSESSLNVPWMFTECSLNVPWMSTECWFRFVLSFNWYDRLIAVIDVIVCWFRLLSYKWSPRSHAFLLLTVHWMFTECSLNVPWTFAECSLNVPWMFAERRLVLLTLVLGTHVGMLYSASTLVLSLLSSVRMGAHRHPPHLHLKILWTCPECTLSVPWMYPERSLNVHWTFPECSLNVPWMFTECLLPVAGRVRPPCLP
jgi:hypothetical protein